MKRTGFFCFNLFAAAMVCSTIASADIIPTYLTDTLTSPGIYTYNYTAIADGASNVITGSELCFAGVAGLVGTPSAPTGWTAADQPGSCPITSGVPATSSIPSVLYTYTGATLTGPASLGTFTFQSTFSTVGIANLAYGGLSQKQSNSTADANQGQVNGPLSSVPEPASMMLLGSGLVLVGLRRFRRK